MNIKDIIISFGLAISIVFLFQNYFGGKVAEDEKKSVRGRIAPKLDAHRPLSTEIDFWDKKPTGDFAKPIETTVETEYARFNFSSEGAALVKADFNHDVGGKQTWLPGIDAKRKEDRCFLLALDEKTPYYYKLVKRTDLDHEVQLEYKTQFDGGSITKIYNIYTKKPKINLTVSYDPTKTLDNPSYLRLIYTVPSMLEAATEAQRKKLNISNDPLFMVLEENNAIAKKDLKDALKEPGGLNRYWESPVNFGGMDRYLVTALSDDHNSFAQRGYYNSFGQDLLKVYLESGAIKEKGSWKLSFYVGPKQASAFEMVNPQFDQLLDYGYFAFLGKPLLKAMNFFYGYINNFGWAIILLTLLIKLLTLPLTLRSEQSMKHAGELQRKMEYIQQKYKNDPNALAQARTEAMRKHGMPMGGCLIPILVQLPVFVALRNVLANSLELYQAPFIWISNLSAPDPYYILPILVAGSIFWQSTSTNTNAKSSMNAIAMSLMMGAFMMGFPAGIALYMFANTFLGILQTIIYRKFKQA